MREVEGGGRHVGAVEDVVLLNLGDVKEDREAGGLKEDMTLGL